MKIDIKLEAFEGPLDLLLHLIEKNKINIYDIPIVEITEQYMAYLHEMEKQYTLESLSEFLVMAATLLKIKSRMLLPKEEEEEEEDPREELVARLVEYKMYKYAAGELKDMSVDAEKVFYKEETVPREIREYEEPIDPEEVVGNLTLAKLNETFQMVMRRKKDREDPVRSKFGKIKREKFKVEDRMTQIQNQVKGLKRINFKTLLDIQPSREMVVVTFLAVLELMKIGEIKVTQDKNFSDIYLDSIDKKPDVQNNSEDSEQTPEAAVENHTAKTHTAQDLETKAHTAQGLEAKTHTAQGLEAKAHTAQGLEAKAHTAQDLETKELKAQDFTAQDMEDSHE